MKFVLGTIVQPTIDNKEYLESIGVKIEEYYLLVVDYESAEEKNNKAYCINCDLHPERGIAFAWHEVSTDGYEPVSVEKTSQIFKHIHANIEKLIRSHEQSIDALVNIQNIITINHNKLNNNG